MAARNIVTSSVTTTRLPPRLGDRPYLGTRREGGSAFPGGGLDEDDPEVGFHAQPLP